LDMNEFLLFCLPCFFRLFFNAKTFRLLHKCSTSFACTSSYSHHFPF
jgi:hypothetical protein